MRPKIKAQFTAIDLFAGGGGLTVGLKRAGFRVLSAVELNPGAYATYKTNHPEVNALKQDIRSVDGQELLRRLGTDSVDLIAGCPPCQGFCSLTSKYQKVDPRNLLVAEMQRLVSEVRPRAVMMENVPGLADKGKVLLDRMIRELKKMGYLVEVSVLQVANYGVPQSRRRLVLLAGKGFKISLPKQTHFRTPERGQKGWRTVGDVLRNLPRPMTLAQSKLKGGPVNCDWNVIRVLSEENLRRLRLAKPGKSWTSIPKRLRPRCHKNEKAGFSNAYGRMAWGNVSPTITGGCTTISKGRFGHPSQLRTISVREASLLQTFPSDYIFEQPFIDDVCEIIGNALPCDFAETVSASCIQALREN